MGWTSHIFDYKMASNFFGSVFLNHSTSIAKDLGAELGLVRLLKELEF
jgi:hypothetical protein